MQPAAWYPDPDGPPGTYRWWDGAAWSDATTRDPWLPPPAPPQQPPPPPAPVEPPYLAPMPPPPRPGAPVGGRPAPPAMTLGPETDGGGRRRGGRGLLIALAVVIVAGLAAAAFAILRAGDGDPDDGTEGQGAERATTTSDTTTTTAPPEGETVLADEFDRDPPAAGGLGDADTGQTWEILGTSSWVIDDGAATIGDPPAANLHMAIVDPGETDGTIDVVISGAAPGTGIFFRYEGFGDHWSLEASTEPGLWDLRMVVANESTTLTSIDVDDPDEVRIEVRLDTGRETVSVTINGTEVDEVVDDAPADATRIGLRTRGNDPPARFESVAFQSVGD